MNNFELIQTIANVATALSFGAVAVQLWYSNQQSKKAELRSRIGYVVELHDQFINNSELVEIYYKIEHDEFFYDDKFKGSTTEIQLDKLLGFFSNIGNLYKNKILNRKDLNFYEYEILTIYNNKNIQNYLCFLQSEFEAKNFNKIKFNDFLIIGELITDEVKSNNSNFKI